MDRFTARFADVTGAYAPSVGAAILILLVGLLAAWVLQALARRALKHTQLDEKLARVMRADGQKAFDSGRWLSRGIFWLVVLVTLLGFFQALGFTPITRPMTGAFDTALGFLPRLLAAAALALAAFIVASFLRMLVGRGLQALRVDERLQRPRHVPAPVGDVGALGDLAAVAAAPPAPRISNALAQAAYYLTWLLFAPAILGALQLQGVLGPVQGMVDKILAFLPNVATAAIILLAAFFLGRIVAGLVSNALAAVGFDRALERIGLARVSDSERSRFVPSRIAGTLTLVIIVLSAAMEAFDVIAFEELSRMTSEMIALAGRVLLGLVVFGAGFVLARYAAKAIQGTSMQGAAFLANAARVAILVLAGAMALRQMGFANEIIQLAFGLTIAGVAAAAAIAFGVGGRHVAGRELERMINRAREKHGTAEPMMPQPH